jgi:N-acetylglucosaminyl-diphospho-decaprenol L-rhamnosyltransferase
MATGSALMEEAAVTAAGKRHDQRPQKAMADVSIVVVTWNSARWIERCVQAIGPAGAGVTYDVTIYDNASEDSTPSKIETIAAREPRFRAVRAENNDGFARATNRAVAMTAGRYVLMLNPDCELEPGALTWLVRFLDANPDVAAAAPLLADADGESQREFQLRRFPSLTSLAFEVLLIDKLVPFNPVTARYRYRDLDLTEPRQVEQPAAAALLIRRSAFQQVGMFDEQFEPAWFEDVDFCRRLEAAGQSAWIVPAAHARHFGGASLEFMEFSKFTAVWYRNMWLYARKWFTRGQSEWLRWFIVGGMLMRLPLAAIGLGTAGTTRREAIRAYAGVLKKALERWDDASRSSS